VKSIGDIDKLISSRGALEAELLELEGLEILANSITQIVQYHNEFQVKSGLRKCTAQLSTTAISKKIGELLETEAILLQQAEFLNHLQSLNKDIASKISISKTKTSSGVTFQRCGFNGINETISNILSEGEQKVVALANFLSECTIDNRTNTIVFDDPITSLDQDYRESVANILVQLSTSRQVIVLSHDLYFVRLLIDTHKKSVGNSCHLIGVENYRGIAGIQSDEIPYLAKNIQERINSIRKDLVYINSLQVTEKKRIEEVLEKLKKQFRKLLEKSIEEILANDSIKRFSKNINLKAGYLSGFVVTEHSDIELILNLFGKYSIAEHDGGIEVTTNDLSQDDIRDDLKTFEDWKNGFNTKLKAFKSSNGYH
jgi:wobble nucleotide-excising tRNase